MPSRSIEQHRIAGVKRAAREYRFDGSGRKPWSAHVRDFHVVDSFVHKAPGPLEGRVHSARPARPSISHAAPINPAALLNRPRRLDLTCPTFVRTMSVSSQAFVTHKSLTGAVFPAYHSLKNRSFRRQTTRNRLWRKRNGCSEGALLYDPKAPGRRREEAVGRNHHRLVSC